MKAKLMALMLVAGGSLFAQTRFSSRVQFGAPGYYAPAPVGRTPVAVAAYRFPCPGPRYIWIDKYRDGYGHWTDGYWALPPYAGAYWVAPRFYDGRFYAGFWNGARGYDRDNYRFRESRAPRWREHEWREHEHDRGFEHRGDFERGFRH